MGRGGGDDRSPWWRSWARDLAVLIVFAESLAWVVRRADASGALLRHWPLVAMLAADVLGFAWSIGRIYRAGPSKQGLPIAGLIASLLGLLAIPFVYNVVYTAWVGGDGL